MLTRPRYLVFFKTILNGSFYDIRTYAGFQYLWFLPAMCSMSVLKLLYETYHSLRIPLLVLGSIFYIIFWVFMFKKPYDISFNYQLMQWSVFSFMLGLGVLFMGRTASGIICRFDKTSVKWFYLLSFILLNSIYFFTSNGGEINRPMFWTIRVLNPLLAMGLLISFVSIYCCKALQNIGKRSLYIYLIHLPLSTIICMVLSKYINQVLALFVSYVLTMTISYFLADFVKKIPFINKSFFPR